MRNFNTTASASGNFFAVAPQHVDGTATDGTHP
jgi:hypothetical protein